MITSQWRRGEKIPQNATLVVFLRFDSKLHFARWFQVTGFLPPKPIAENTKDAQTLSAAFFWHANFVLSFVKVVLDLIRKLQPTLKTSEHNIT